MAGGLARVPHRTLALPEGQQTPPPALKRPNIGTLEWIYGIGSRFIPFGGILGAAAIAGAREAARLDPTTSREGTLGLLNVSQGLVQHDSIQVSAKLAPYLTKLEEFAAAQGGHIRWTSGYRSEAEQEALRQRWAAGDPNVPFEPLPYAQSKHGTGDAADGEASNPALALALGNYARSIGMGWNPHEVWHFEV